MQPSSTKTVFQKLSRFGLLWALVYGLLNIVSNQLTLPAAPIIAVRPQVALPMLIGFFYGPLPGFLTGFLGNIFGDVLYGYGVVQFWNWHIANGLMGLIPGLTARFTGIKVMRTVRDFGIIEGAVVASCALSIAAAVCLDLLFTHLMHFPESLNAWVLPAFINNAVGGFILVPIFFLLTRRVLITLETRTILTITSLLVMAILSTSITITWAMHDDLTSYNALVNAIYVAGIVSVIIVVIGFCSSIYFVKRITGPVTLLTQAAASVEKGEYNLQTLLPVSGRTDELGQLSRVLQKMAGEVWQREQALKKQVHDLQIEIDRKRIDREVEEITSTDYFRDLRDKARKFRENKESS